MNLLDNSPFKRFIFTKKGLTFVISLILGSVLTVLILFNFLPFAKETLFSKIFPKKISKATSDTSYTKGLLVLKYFPTKDGVYLDPTVTGIQNGLLTFYKDKVVSLNNNLQSAIREASSYQKFQNPTAPNSLDYFVVATFSYDQTMPLGNQVPWNPGWYRPDYYKILTDHNICDWVENKGVREVWIWGYHGGQTEPVESNMAGPWGDISNSERTNDMPTCKTTYVLYNYNYDRGTAEALESWGHQIEAEMDAIDRILFRDLWQGPNYPQALGVNGRCGSVHNPPNARWEYDRANTTSQQSDCLDWNPDSLGTLSAISCQAWGCQDRGDLDNPARNYMVWNWQNLPGRNNTKTYQGKKLRNFWDIHGDFDNVMANNRSLILPTPTPTPTPSPLPSPTSSSNPIEPSPTPTPTPTPTPPPGDTVPPTVTVTNPADGSSIPRNTTINITASASDNVGVTKVEFRVNNRLKCSDTTSPYTCSWKVPGKLGGTYTIQAKAQDPAGNTSSHTVNITTSR